MSIWMGYTSVVFAASSAFLLARWRYSRADVAPRERMRSHFFDASLQAPASPDPADVASAAQAALQRVGHLMARQFVRVDIAIPPGLTARMRQPTLTDIIEEMLVGAIQAAPASRLLLTGLRQGDQVEIVITDDMPGADVGYRQGRTRDLSERVALRGGVLQVTVQPTEGTTTILRVLAAVEESGAPATPVSSYSPHSSYQAEDNTL